MNWLGHEIQKYVEREDIVLDLGCGIMQATTNILDKNKKFYSPRNRFNGNLRCKTIVGVDIWTTYLDIIKMKYPTIKLPLTELKYFIENSYDVVMALDVLEHLELSNALSVINEMKRIARKYVIVYTPNTFHTNEENINAWNMGNNPYQIHKCNLSENILLTNGFIVKQLNHNNLAVWRNVI